MDNVLESYEDLGERTLTVPGRSTSICGRAHYFTPDGDEIAGIDFEDYH